MFPVKEIEKGILAVFENNFSKTIYNIWFSDLQIYSMNEEKIVFCVPSEFKKKILLTQYKSSIEDAIEEACGFPFPFEIGVFDTPEARAFKKNEEEMRAEMPKELLSLFESRPKKEDIGPEIEGPSIIKEYTFENFIVGESNKFAHAACLAVSRSMASYNPLFIYGQSGLGKTHLLYAITNELKKNNPNIRIVYKKGDEFTNELIASIQNGSTSYFREKYRTADVLLIDDIQFIAGKESTQEEFFHTFSSLYEAEKQIILTSDRPPKEIRTLEERLRTRFEWGLIADIQPPSFELRTAIIRKKAESLNIELSPEHVNRMAEHLNCNVRQIEGAIKKVAALALLGKDRRLSDMDIDAVISDFESRNTKKKDLSKVILSVIHEKYGVTEDDIRSTKRSANIALARHITVYMLHELMGVSFSKIGAFLNRDHTTVLASNSNIEEKMKKDSSFQAEIEEMMQKCRESD